MEKVLYVLWRPQASHPDEFRAALVGPLAERLVAAGAVGVQVNAADSAVDGALIRMTILDPPIDAVVGAWVHSAVDALRRPLDAAVAQVADRWAGYVVSESEPLRDADRAPDAGGRTPGFAQLAFLRRPAHLTHDEWVDRWLNGQTQVAIETQATFRYVQNLVVRRFGEDPPPFAAIVEECFPLEALGDLHAFFDTGGDDAELQRRMAVMGASTARFLDDGELDVVPTSEYVVPSPA